MRLLPWLGSFLVLGLIGVAVGAATLGHAHATPPLSLTAAHHQTMERLSVTTGSVHSIPHNFTSLVPSPSPEPVSATQPAPQPAIVVRTTQQALINSDRASRGLGPLTWNGCLYNVALANARRIASQEYLSHTNGPSADLSCGLGRQAGENIGWYSGGINDTWMNNAFMASPDHYANIMGPYHYVATAWVTTADGKGWIAVEFG